MMNENVIEFRDAILDNLYSEWPEARPAVKVVMARVNENRRFTVGESNIVNKALSKVDGYDMRMLYARHLCSLVGVLHIYEGKEVPQGLVDVYNEACEIAVGTWAASPNANN